ncbi:hypothetical protein BC940DRAFT_61356 [Gongronella butleri]|nr:hypothetical protein BC940DRAFT_61356 [Gongronella butleri]
MKPQAQRPSPPRGEQFGHLVLFLAVMDVGGGTRPCDTGLFRKKGGRQKARQAMKNVGGTYEKKKKASRADWAEGDKVL